MTAVAKQKPLGEELGEKKKPLIKIESPIVSCSVASEGKVEPSIVPHQRPGKVLGSTYKIKPPTMNAALYITINHIELDDGTPRPIEVFLNTKDTTHAQWMHALTRLLSAQFRSPLPFEFALQELKEVVDPQGSYFIPGGGGSCGGIVDHVARVIEDHLVEIGAIGKTALAPEQQQALDKKKSEAEAKGVKASECPKCRSNSMYLLDGCMTCTSCGESKCG